MKKIIYFILFIVISICITGCSNKQKLICKKTLKSDGVTIVNTNILIFEKEKINKMKMEYNYILDNEYIKNAENIKKNIDKQFRKFAEYKGIDYKSELIEKNSKIKYKIEIDLNKVDEAGKEAFNITGNESYEINKKALEKAGFKCN